MLSLLMAGRMACSCSRLIDGNIVHFTLICVSGLGACGSLALIFSMLQVTVITKTSVLFQCKPIPMVQRDSISTDKVFKKVKHVFLSLVVEISTDGCTAVPHFVEYFNRK